MIKRLCLLLLLCSSSGLALAQTMFLNTDNSQYQLTNTFSNVGVFNIRINLSAALAPGIYNNPDIDTVTYQVSGALANGTPSGFATFDLRREITGTEFYAQGSSLSFQIVEGAVLSDGVQVAELAGRDVVLTFDARELDNGRFHPVLLELNANGTGRIQNSNNIPSITLDNEVDFGEEYITDLVFDPGNTTVITGIPQGSGGGTIGIAEIATLIALLSVFRLRRQPEV